MKIFCMAFSKPIDLLMETRVIDFILGLRRFYSRKNVGYENDI